MLSIMIMKIMEIKLLKLLASFILISSLLISNAFAEDEDGTLRTLEVDLDLSSNDQSKLPSKTVIDKELEKFASLQDQIHVKYNDYENYGDKIVKITS